MKYLKKIAFVIVLLGFIGALLIVWMFNKPHKNIQTAKADFQFTTHEWIAEFGKEDSIAHLTYFDRVIELTGEADQVQQVDSLIMLTFVSDNANFQLSCMMDPKEKSQIDTRGKLRIKCLYAGYLSPDEEFELPGDIKCKNCFVIK